MNDQDNAFSATRLPIRRYYTADQRIDSDEDEVVVEQAIHLLIDGMGSFTLLCTPAEIKALTIGFLFTEGLIKTIDDIVDISDYHPDSQSITVKLEDTASVKTDRHFLITSSCGFCGKRNIEALYQTILPCPGKFLVYLDRLEETFEKFRQVQSLFKKTGAAHAAALFDQKGRIVSISEDIGRHNALDKVIGKRLLEKRDFKKLGLALSGRVSFEMVVKAARAQIELIAAISAPTSLAVEAAKHWNLSLCGFIRSGRVNIYHDLE